jgi:hypothetical protein
MVVWVVKNFGRENREGRREKFFYLLYSPS